MRVQVINRQIRILVTGVGAPGIRGTLYALRHNPDRTPVHFAGTDSKLEAVGQFYGRASLSRS